MRTEYFSVRCDLKFLVFGCFLSQCEDGGLSGGQAGPGELEAELCRDEEQPQCVV